jgi:hypothetical protein
MAQGHGNESIGIDRMDYLRRANNSLSSRYIPGFWTWLKEERPVEYEIINYEQERLHEESMDGTDDNFQRATKRYWGRIAAQLLDYKNDPEAQETYKVYL